MEFAFINNDEIDLKIKNFEEKREFQDQISGLEQRIKELNEKVFF